MDILTLTCNLYVTHTRIKCSSGVLPIKPCCRNQCLVNLIPICLISTQLTFNKIMGFTHDRIFEILEVSLNSVTLEC